MKKMLLLLFVAFILASCGNRTKENSTNNEFVTSTNEEIVEEIADEYIDETADELKDAVQELEEVAEELSGDVSAEWDELLDEYEEYINDYVACLKKVAKGDMDAMLDMADLLEDAQDMTDEISEISDNLTASQAARYTKLSKKLLDAAAEM